MEPFLKICNINKSFGKLTALNGVSTQLERGEITSLIGPNGAGKTTLFNIINGVLRPDKGDVFFENVNLCKLKTHKIIKCGLARTFQIIQLLNGISVLENIMIGLHVHNKSDFLSIGMRLKRAKIEEESNKEKAFEVLKFLNLENKAHHLATQLPLGHQRLVEIGRALVSNPRLILLDEPASGFNTYEKNKLADILLRIINKGVSIFMVEHDMSFVMDISNKIVVINFGEKIAEGRPADIKRDDLTIKAYLGAKNA
jgi:branched-chain amino acid transport system ATP-binding protein